MPNQLLIYYIKDPLVVLSINSGCWKRIVLVRLDIEIWEIGEGGTKRGLGSGVGEWRKRYGGCWVLWPLFVCVFLLV
jgi:hypothetical protein